jgi:hypothetical protein
MESIMIDSTIVRAHACSAGCKKDSNQQECIGRSKGGFTTKIHAVVDALGNPLRFILSSGHSKIKHFRRVFSRFDKTADVFIGFLHFVSVLIWLC